MTTQTLKQLREAKTKKRIQQLITTTLITGAIASQTFIPHTVNAITLDKSDIKPIVQQQYLSLNQLNRLNHFNQYDDSITPLKKAIIAANAEKQAAEKQAQAQAQAEALKQQALQQQVLQQQALQQQQNEKATFVSLARNENIESIDLRTPSGLTGQELDSMLQGTRLAGLGGVFVDCEHQYGVNAVYLAAHAAWESGWGTSILAMYKNNLYGFTAYDSSPGASAMHFSSKSDCIYTVASYVSQHYLNKNGDHYNGPTLQGINIQYASDKDWSRGVSSIMETFISKVNL